MKLSAVELEDRLNRLKDDLCGQIKALVKDARQCNRQALLGRLELRKHPDQLEHRNSIGYYEGRRFTCMHEARQLRSSLQTIFWEDYK